MRRAEATRPARLAEWTVQFETCLPTEITSASPLASNLHLRWGARRSSRDGWRPGGQGFASPWIPSQVQKACRQQPDRRPSTLRSLRFPSRPLSRLVLNEHGNVLPVKTHIDLCATFTNTTNNASVSGPAHTTLWFDPEGNTLTVTGVFHRSPFRAWASSSSTWAGSSSI